MIKKTTTFEYEDGTTMTYQEFVDSELELGDIEDVDEEIMEQIETLLDLTMEVENEDELDKYLDELTQLVHSVGGELNIKYFDDDSIGIDVRL